MIEASFPPPPPPPPDSALSESAIKPDMNISEKSLNLAWWVTYRLCIVIYPIGWSPAREVI